MNIRDENVLRELNLYPLWVRRDVSAAPETPPVSPASADAAQPASRLGGGAADTQRQSPSAAESVSSTNDTQQSAMGIVEPVLSAVEGLNRACVVGALAPYNHGLPFTGTSYVSSLNWGELKQKVHDCTACKLRAGCTQTVFGVGDEKAEWLFVGEGPGADEDAKGEPFVGQAGRLLDNMLAAIKLKRGENVYIANIVKCRPPGNRTPEADEIATCLPYLQRQIALIKPKLIVALGKTAATSLLGRDATLGSLRGTLHEYQGVPLVVTYHPAYLLRSPAEKAKAWQDLCFAVKRMSA